MDKVLFIDGDNAIWRANTSFGPPVEHKLCEAHHLCEHASAEKYHCQCNSPYNVEEQFCYGDRYYVVFNFFRNLRPLIEQFSPVKCFFVLEGHPQFRYDLYADYKANRLIKEASRADAKKKMMEGKEMILSLLPHLPLTTARAVHYEADDTIASLCDNMKEEDLVIISGDSDFIQLLQRGYSQIQVYHPIKKIYLEAPTYPYVAWKCLNGDKSDNIPKLLSPKKALATVNDPELFQKFLSVEENRANFSINRQLIEFGKVPEEEIELQEGQRNFQYLFDAFSQMKFGSIIRPGTWDRYVETFNCIKY
jgi:5'-3' exonuclease